MEWRLDSPPCDWYEREFAGYVRSTFPNYEHFWREFVVPLTGRPASSRLAAPPKLERMAEAHYSVFWHLLNAHLCACRLAGESHEELVLEARPAFEATFLHLGAGTEMVEEFLYTWADINVSCETEPGLAMESPRRRVSTEEVVRKSARFCRRQYRNQMRGFRRSGRPVGVELHSKRKTVLLYVSRLSKADPAVKTAWAAFERTSQAVRSYRNRLVHGVVLATQIRGTRLLVPTPALMQDPRRSLTWSRVRRSVEGADLLSATELAGQYQCELEEAVNGLWSAVVPYFRRLARTPKYQEWLAASGPGAGSVGRGPDLEDMMCNSPISGSTIFPADAPELPD